MPLPHSLFRWVLPLATAAVLAACGGDSNTSEKPVPAPQIADGTRATVALLETSDLHSNIRSYDYFKLAEDQSYGFERTATLIQQARSEFANNVLLDNGDTIQGTALADYEATVNPVSCEQTLSMYRVMNHYKYDVGTLGNHEFNYGLPFLSQVLGGGLNVGGVDPGVTPDFFEDHLVDAGIALLDVGEPAFESQVAHAAAFEALRTEAFGTAGDVAVAAALRPAGGGAQIEGEEGGCHGFNPCLGWSDAADTACRNSP